MKDRVKGVRERVQGFTKAAVIADPGKVREVVLELVDVVEALADEVEQQQGGDDGRDRG